jgi:PrtD family type I secretion system ABC transporter
VRAFFSGAFRLLGWTVLASALAGLVHDSRYGADARLGDVFGTLGWALPAADAAWPLDTLHHLAVTAESLPGWPVLLLLGGVLLLAAYGLRRSGRKAAPAETASAPRSGAVGPGDGANQPGRELHTALGSFRGAFAGVAAFSGISNLLMLTGSFFMLEVYDRVLPSRSLSTLVAISMLAALLFIAQGLLDLTRARLLARVGAGLDESVSARVYDAVVRLPLRTNVRNDGQQPIRDLDTLRTFLSGQGLPALCDLPWMPLYLLIIYMFHPVLGLTALVGVLFLVGVTLMTEILSGKPTRDATEHAMARNSIAETGRRNAEVLAAMGMGPAIQARWEEANRRFVQAQLKITDVTGGFGSLSRVFRMMLQSAVLAVGAYLVIRGEASAGIIIAGSILASRALAPVELAIANWRGFVAARHSWQRLKQLLRLMPAEAQPMALPAPTSLLSVDAASGTAPGEQRLIVQDVTFTLKAGQGLAVMGPSASGKSTLARMLVGVWQPVRGSVRLDGAALDQWSSAMLGRHIGYLPQDVELFPGSVAQNISRFDPAAKPEGVVAAARAAGVHDLIVNLKDGYETQIGDQGRALSAGQQQRVALARALYGDPFLVVLDEPNSNLDAEGDAALTEAILKARARGAIVIVVAHRPSAIAGLNLVLAMHHGRQQIFGPKEEVLAKILRPTPQLPPAIPRPAAEKARG